MTVAPRAVEALYGNSAQKIYQDEAAKIQDPLVLIGYQDAQPTITSSGCHTMFANGFKTQIVCGYSYDLMQDMPASDEDKQALAANAEKLQALLQANGWQGEYANDGQPYTSLVKLVTSLNAGIDYQPDATYQKQAGDVTCTFGNNTAFSSPDTPKMSTQIYCSRTFNLVGDPSPK